MNATLTRSGRPKVAPLDTATLRAAAEVEVHAILDPITDVREKLAKAAALDLEAEAVVKGNTPHMHKLVTSLALREGARGLSNAVGLSRARIYDLTTEALGGRTVKGTDGKTHVEYADGWVRPVGWSEALADRAKAKRVRLYKDARTQLPEVAAKVYSANARREALRPIRNDLIRELRASGVTRDEIGSIIMRDPSRVSHITTGRG